MVQWETTNDRYGRWGPRGDADHTTNKLRALPTPLAIPRINFLGNPASRCLLRCDHVQNGRKRRQRPNLLVCVGDKIHRRHRLYQACRTESRVKRNCSARSVPRKRRPELWRAPCVGTLADIGSSWESLTVVLNLHTERINANRGGGTGFDREWAVYRTRVKVSGNVTGELVTRRAGSSQGFIHLLRGSRSHAAGTPD